MLAKSTTCAVVGLDGYIVQVEVDISQGLPAFNIVGLPDTAVQESRERVRAASRSTLLPPLCRKLGLPTTFPLPSQFCLAPVKYLQYLIHRSSSMSYLWTEACDTPMGFCSWSPSPGTRDSSMTLKSLDFERFSGNKKLLNFI